MPATKRGVYHNIKESKYTISDGEVVYFFSSRSYLRKMLLNYKDHRRKTQDFYEKHTGVQLNTSLFSDIQLYKKIEKRGFYVWVKGVEVEWHDLVEYALAKMTRKNTLDLSEIPKPKLTERLRIME